MNKIRIFDNLFAHAKYSTDNQESEYIDWCRNDDIKSDIIFYTDNSIRYAKENNNNSKKYGWLIESPLVTKSAYSWIKNNYEIFENIFTHNKELLELSDKFKFSPTGGCWIFKEEQKIYNKNKNISIISSGKKYLPGHLLRHQIIDKYKFIDHYGRNNNPLKNKIDGLKDYRFSFAIENAKVDYYFTEKIIDCFVTGTIPIYWGCPSIGKFFNENGMILIDDLNTDFDKKMLWLRTNGEDVYNDMLPYIKENFEKSKDYIMSEDYIWKKYFIKDE